MNKALKTFKKKKENKNRVNYVLKM
uniref:Uncharacterized protein n=1 Tax=Anguilla anguilla TaxID=7936 RepID=A0A0E9WE88_ANGAN